jgi:hypothetical protein
MESRASKPVFVVSWKHVNADIVKSYCCGATNVFSWIAICAGIAIIVPQLCLGMAIFWNPTYVPQAWHAFLVYQAANVLVLVYNIYLLRRTMWVHDLACMSLVMRQLPARC